MKNLLLLCVLFASCQKAATPLPETSNPVSQPTSFKVKYIYSCNYTPCIRYYEIPQGNGFIYTSDTSNQENSEISFTTDNKNEVFKCCVLKPGMMGAGFSKVEIYINDNLIESDTGSISAFAEAVY